ncbi:hypothetical protein L6R52_29245 [Myxococcota bacterium]|nr:hypothetical protein [Myxococcota bacterium]
MNDTNTTNELIVRFKSGISEDVARAAVARAGATVRRRMRTDFPNEVMLLVRTGAGKLEEVDQKMKAMPSVISTEVNQGGFSAK